MGEGLNLISQSTQIPGGVLLVQGPVSTSILQELTLDQGLRAFRPPNRQKEALLEISRLENGRIIIARLEQNIVGYVTFHPPDSFERWSHGPQEILELGAIEVAPCVRRYGVGKKLLEVAFSDESMERCLVVATEYYWHWDLEGTGLHVWEYREVMRQLMAHIGMVVKDTDEEEIAAHPANMLTVRYGKHIPRESILAFEALLFSKPDSNRG